MLSWMVYLMSHNAILKYPGGKKSELTFIRDNLPHRIRDFYDPFVGGGSVFLNIECDRDYHINDISNELIQLYLDVQNLNPVFFNDIQVISNAWDTLSSYLGNQEVKTQIITILKEYFQDNDWERLEIGVTEFLDQHSEPYINMAQADIGVKLKRIKRNTFDNIIRKIARMERLRESRGALSDEDMVKNIASAIKSTFYYHFRNLYNLASKGRIGDQHRSAYFFFIREYCFSSMFRYNQQGDFNVPYGGVSYNKKSISSKIEYMQSDFVTSLFSRAHFYNEDFETFLRKKPLTYEDLVFIDPPYDTEFSSYSGDAFQKKDQRRLQNYLLNHCQAKFLMVIKETDFINSLYLEKSHKPSGVKITIERYEKNYSVSFINRNKKNVTHLIIRNY